MVSTWKFTNWKIVEYLANNKLYNLQNFQYFLLVKLNVCVQLFRTWKQLTLAEEKLYFWDCEVLDTVHAMYNLGKYYVNRRNN